MQDTLSSIISTIKQLQHKLQKKISQLSIFYHKLYLQLNSIIKLFQERPIEIKAEISIETPASINIFQKSFTIKSLKRLVSFILFQMLISLHFVERYGPK